MRLSLAPFIALLVSALAFLFAYMTEGIGVLPWLFNLAGIAALAIAVIATLQALLRLARTLIHRKPAPLSHPGASQTLANKVMSINEPGA